MKIVNVVGARPNFIKIAPIIREIGRHKNLTQWLVHTGQHYDFQMSKIFFNDLKIPKPDVYLSVNAKSQPKQIAEIIGKLEDVLKKTKPDLVLVVGDVNSTCAAALTASRMGIKIAHVEAGLRSFDRTMPEETNRIVTDHLSDYLFVTEDSGMRNLLKEGINKEKIFFTGNVMIDSLVHCRKVAHRKMVKTSNEPFCLVTLHRPSNVDDPYQLESILAKLVEIACEIKVVWPLHHRTRLNIKRNNLSRYLKSLDTIEPLGYIEFLMRLEKCLFVITDSGGIQEETTYLGIPCFTLRNNTERPVTVKLGTNKLVNLENLTASIKKLAGGVRRIKTKIPKWDGKAAERIVNKILELEA